MAAILVSEVAMPADEKTVVNLRLEPEFLARIDEHRFQYRWRSRMAAIKYLLDFALQSAPEPTLGDHERWS